MPSPADSAAVTRLRDPATIRERCREILTLAQRDALTHFRLHPERIDAAVDRVVATIAERYPDLRIPFHSRWRHFQIGGVDRWNALAEGMGSARAADVARSRIDLAVVSVLLDAGAGDAWRYLEPGSAVPLSRSEGLALASLQMFAAGAFSADPAEPLRADAAALRRMDLSTLERGFQVRPDNPLVGAGGRVALLASLGEALEAHPELFGDPPRVGNLFDHLRECAGAGGLPARTVFAAVLTGLASIWPGRLTLGGENLGDVWRHRAIRRDDPSDGLIPFHKLSQWLTYSLVEPLEDAGLRVTELETLTGLAEYRNGGLLVDTGVLECRRPPDAGRLLDVGAELVVEWRALTVALLDELAQRVRARLGRDADALPLVSILEGGTWEAGRRIARERRAGGGPPIAVSSDGTVF